MKKPGMSPFDFTKNFKHKDIKEALSNFALLHKSVFPDQVVREKNKKIILLDVLRAAGAEVLLPVAIKSNELLRFINKLDKNILRVCLYTEIWPHFNRIQLIGGLVSLCGQKTEQSLCDYLKYSIDYWASLNFACSVCISDRADELLQSDESKKLKKNICIIKLPEEYKEKQIVF